MQPVLPSTEQVLLPTSVSASDDCASSSVEIPVTTHLEPEQTSPTMSCNTVDSATLRVQLQELAAKYAELEAENEHLRFLLERYSSEILNNISVNVLEI